MASQSTMNGALFSWFRAHRRDLAFRRTRDPYAVLVAEVMLQQTQVGRVEPAWGSFMARFPTIADVASASPADVLRTWGGLGYYGRAIRLQRTARAVVERHGGRVPDSIGELEALPGIGPYTARAVAAIAFESPVAAVDTNVGRVIRRVLGMDGVGDPSVGGVRAADSPAVVQRLADEMVDRARPGEWTHAMMDLGALVCRTRDPRCGECPLRPSCRAAPMLMAAAGRPVPGLRGVRRRAEGSKVPVAAQRMPVAVPRVQFPATRRWLRGRIMARLREEVDGTWVSFDGPIGQHPSAAVLGALRQLAAEGLLELDPRGGARLGRA